MTHGAEYVALEQLREELIARGFTVLVLPSDGGRMSYLEVSNPEAPRLAERVVANANGFWWPWAERIAVLDQVGPAARLVAQVLAVHGE
jgi:hypothetical protein